MLRDRFENREFAVTAEVLERGDGDVCVLGHGELHARF